MPARNERSTIELLTAALVAVHKNTNSVSQFSDGYNQRNCMPTYPHIDSYYEQLRELIEFGGATNEENIRLAFLNCLSEYCKEHSERFVLVPELRSDRSNKPDGTVRDSLRMTRGLWEAKDTHDDLDREIRNKLGQGYSGDNILFENSRTAVLVQSDQEVMRTDMANAATLDELIRRFLDYELPEIQARLYAKFRGSNGCHHVGTPPLVGWRRRVFHYPPPTLMSRNFRLPCTIELQPLSLMPLKMRKVEPRVSGSTAAVQG